MVKETKYRHHPVRIENGLYLGSQQLDIAGFRLDLQDAVLVDEASQSTTTVTLWRELTLNNLITTPDDAIAIVISVEVNDSGSAATLRYMGFCPTGRAMAGRCQYVYCASGQNDRKGSRILIVELSDDTYPSIGYRILATGATFDYSINLIGWLIGGTRVPRLAIPAEDLLCRVTVVD